MNGFLFCSYLYHLIKQSLKIIFTSIALILFCMMAYSQPGFSAGTDISILRNFSKHQGFTSIGQTVHFDFHITKKETIYTWISYYLNGKYKNDLTATAKDAFTSPQNMSYISSSRLGISQVSVGLKHFFKGRYDNDSTWNLYGSAGFGLLSARVENAHTKSIDTALYEKPQKAIAGAQRFKRLTFDLALGMETQLGASIFLFGEIRTWLKASGYPSPYLYDNTIPRVVILNGGVRVLFD